MSNLKKISFEDAKEAVELLSRAFNFAIYTTCKTYVERVGDEVLVSNVEWTTELRWPGKDLLYLKTKAGKYEQVACVTRDEIAAFPQILEELEGAKLCTYTPYKMSKDSLYGKGDDEGYAAVAEIPEFSSLSELKMKLAIKGLA